jgi:hypothetical protein
VFYTTLMTVLDEVLDVFMDIGQNQISIIQN